MGITNIKQLTILAALGVGLSSMHAQQETFEFLNASATSYSEGAFVGDNGSLWTFAGVRSVRNQFAIEGTSMGFGDQALPERFVQTFIGVQGIGDLQLQMRSYFTAGTAGERTIRVLVDGDEVGSQTLEAMGTVENMLVRGIDREGPLSLRIEAVGSRQIVIDNLAWTPVPPPQPAPPAPFDFSWIQSDHTGIQLDWQQAEGVQPRGYLLIVDPHFRGEWPTDGREAAQWQGMPGVHLLNGNDRSFRLSGLQPGVPYQITLIPYSNNGQRTRYTAPDQLPKISVQLVHTAQWPIPEDDEAWIVLVLRELLGYPPGEDELQFWLHRYRQVGNLTVWLEEALRMPHLLRQREFLATHYLWWGHFPNTRYWYIDVQRDLVQREQPGLAGLVLWLAQHSPARPVMDPSEEFRFIWRNRHGVEPTLPQQLQAAYRLQTQVGPQSEGQGLNPLHQLLIDLASERPGTRTPVIAEPPNADWYLASRLTLLIHHFWPYAYGAASQVFLQPRLHLPLEQLLRELMTHPHYLHRHQYYWLGAWGAYTGFALPGVGWFWYDEDSWPWVWFASSGWAYIFPGKHPDREAFLWSESHGWLYWNRDWLPWMFSFEQAEWSYGW